MLIVVTRLKCLLNELSTMSESFKLHRISMQQVALTERIHLKNAAVLNRRQTTEEPTTQLISNTVTFLIN